MCIFVLPRTRIAAVMLTGLVCLLTCLAGLARAEGRAFEPAFGPETTDWSLTRQFRGSRNGGEVFYLKDGADLPADPRAPGRPRAICDSC